MEVGLKINEIFEKYFETIPSAFITAHYYFY